jgi:hypothetical protein
MTDKLKPGRKPIGEKAMTPAERKRAQRARQKAAQQQDAYLKMAQEDLQKFSDLAATFNTTRTEIMGGLLGGALKQLQRLDELLQCYGETKPEQVALYKHKALLLMYEGASLEGLYKQIFNELVELSPDEEKEFADILSGMSPQEIEELKSQTKKLLGESND